MPVSQIRDFAPLDAPTADEMDRIAEAAQPWTTYTPTVAGVTTSSAEARWTRYGDTVKVRFRITLSAVPTGTVAIALPVAASTDIGSDLVTGLGVVSGLRQGVGYRTGVVTLASSATFCFIGDGRAVAWGAGEPVAWASTDIWGGIFEYEAA